MLGQLAVGLLPNQFVARVSPPEIYPGALKKLARGAAEELDQGGRIGAFRSFRGNPQKEFLKRFVGTTLDADFRRRRQIASCHIQSATECRRTILT
ncbi:MAG: hypothetical protein ACLPND_04710, partial [Candidatus Korobacteraceae bacterium]